MSSSSSLSMLMMTGFTGGERETVIVGERGGGRKRGENVREGEEG